MGYFLKKYVWYKKNQGSGLELTDVIGAKIRLTADIKGSSSELTLLNPANRIVNGRFLHKYVQDNVLSEFGEGDTINVFVAYSDNLREIDTSADSDDLLFVAEVVEIVGDLGEGKSTIVLKCVNRTFSMLNKLWTYSYDINWTDSDGNKGTAPVIIRDVIRQVSHDVYSDLSSYDVGGRKSIQGSFSIDARFMSGEYPCISDSPPAFIQVRRPATGTLAGGTFENNDARNFPQVTIGKVFKPVYEFIKELSSINMTNTSTELDSGDPPCDRNYIFYIDYANRFHWFYPEDSKQTTLSVLLGVNDSSVSVASASGFLTNGIIQIGEEVISYTGISGNTFIGLTRGFNNTVASTHAVSSIVTNALKVIEGDTSTGFHVYSHKLNKKTFDIINFVIFNAGKDLYGSGITDYFYDENTDSKDLKETSKPYTHITKDLFEMERKAGRLTQDNAVTSPFTFDGNRYKETTGTYNGGSGITTGWGVVVTSNATYNSAFRTRAIIEGKRAAARLTARRGSPRWKGTIVLRFFRFNPGELINLTSYSVGIINTDLRINEIEHSIEKSGVFTTLSIEEDERKRGE